MKEPSCSRPSRLSIASHVVIETPQDASWVLPANAPGERYHLEDRVERNGDDGHRTSVGQHDFDGGRIESGDPRA